MDSFQTSVILLPMEDNAVEVAADEVSQHDADVHSQDLPCMSLQKCYRNAEIVEGIGNAVGESAHDEERNRKQEREIVLLPGKLHRSRHHESATDSKKSTAPCTCLQAEFEDILGSTLDVHGRHT